MPTTTRVYPELRLRPLPRTGAHPELVEGSALRPALAFRQAQCERWGQGRASSRSRLRIAFAFELMRELRTTTALDAAGAQHVHAIGLHIVEKTLIVGDQQHALVGATHNTVDARADGF